MEAMTACFPAKLTSCRANSGSDMHVVSCTVESNDVFMKTASLEERAVVVAV